MEKSITRHDTELRNARSEQAKITKKFNLKLKRLYSQELNLAKRLRILMQHRAELEMLVKKNRLSSSY